MKICRCCMKLYNKLYIPSLYYPKGNWNITINKEIPKMSNIYCQPCYKKIEMEKWTIYESKRDGMYKYQ